MAKASIHFKAVESSSEAHNERSTKLDYNFPDLEKNNESLVTDRVADRLRAIRAHCKAVSGRKLQSNAEPIREAVVNLNAHHTMADLKELAKVLKEKKGIQCFQIHIHRDEGKSREELNYHAHMLFDWQDKATGKTLKLNRADLSQIQDIVASTLGMERGEMRVNSNRERLEAVEYKRKQEEHRAKEAEIRAKEAQESIKTSRAVLSDVKKELNDLNGLKIDISKGADAVLVKKKKLGLFEAIDEKETVRHAKALVMENKALRNELFAVKSKTEDEIQGLYGQIYNLQQKLKQTEESVKIYREWTENLAKSIIQKTDIGQKNLSILTKMFDSIAQLLNPKPQEKRPEITPENNHKKNKGMSF